MDNKSIDSLDRPVVLDLSGADTFGLVAGMCDRRVDPLAVEHLVKRGLPLEGLAIDQISGRALDWAGLISQNCTFSDCQFSSLNLSGARFSHSTLLRDNLAGARLTRASFQNTEILDSDLSTARAGHVSFRRCHFQTLRMTDAILDDAFIADCSYASGDFSGGAFNGSIFLSFRGRDPASSPLCLRGCDLSGACLLDVDLRHADLRDARFTGSLLCDVDLRGALLEGAQWSGVFRARARLSPGVTLPGGLPRGAGSSASSGRPGLPSSEDIVRSYLDGASSAVAQRLALELCQRLACRGDSNGPGQRDGIEGFPDEAPSTAISAVA